MIKGRSPFPFETIAVAVSFSPGLEAIVTETKRLCYLHGALAVFIHIGKKTGDKHRQLIALLNTNGFHDGNSRIYWEQADGLNSLLQVCKHEVVDLLLAGISDKDDFHLPAGHFAKELVSKAKCSLMLFSRQNPGNGYNNIFVHTPEHSKTEFTISTGLYFAEKENAERLMIFDELSELSGELEVTTIHALKKWSFALRTALEESKVLISYGSSTGVSANEFAFQNNADLLILNSTDHHLRIFDRIFSGTLERTVSDPACHILIVHSRLDE